MSCLVMGNCLRYLAEGHVRACPDAPASCHPVTFKKARVHRELSCGEVQGLTIAGGPLPGRICCLLEPCGPPTHIRAVSGRLLWVVNAPLPCVWQPSISLVPVGLQARGTCSSSMRGLRLRQPSASTHDVKSLHSSTISCPHTDAALFCPSLSLCTGLTDTITC